MKRYRVPVWYQYGNRCQYSTMIVGYRSTGNQLIVYKIYRKGTSTGTGTGNSKKHKNVADVTRSFL